MAETVAWNLNREELAWAAGFFDGEGHISAYLNSNGKKKYLRTNVDIRQCDPEVLERFRAAVGVGNIHGPHGPYGRPNSRPHWVYQAAGYQRAVAVVGLLWPFLSSIKREQAHAALSRYLGRGETERAAGADRTK